MQILRFAPSPTGYLHVGGARTALFNWLWARRSGGKFLLRIEDTDRERSTDESTRAIFEGLKWLGLGWDDEVVFQGANLERHRADAFRLLESGHAYHDFTTVEELDRLRKEAEQRKETFRFDRRMAELPPDELKRRLDAGVPYAIRFRVPEGETGWDDVVHGRVTFPNKDIDDFVILRSDGTPVYNHAVVSDDIAMGITLVMRGDDHISNTPKQILLFRALGAPLPQFAHLPMIHGPDGKKLSKRHGATAVADWQHAGILPSAMVNFLALLGWSPGGNIEVMDRDELISRFDLDGLLRKASVFDTKKLEWMNGQHLSMTPAADLIETLGPLVTANGRPPSWFVAGDQRLHDVVDLTKVRARTTLQLAERIRVFFEAPEPSTFEPAALELLRRPRTPAALNAVRDVLSRAADGVWTEQVVRTLLEPVPAAIGAKAGEVFQPLRAALTGSTVSPEIYLLVLHIGREACIDRIDAALAMAQGTTA